MAEGGETIVPLSDETLEKAKKELNEIPEERTRAIEELRENARKANETENLTLERLDDDAFLLRFLRCKKFRQEDALKKYLTYCRFMATHSELFEGLCVDKVRYIYERNVFGVIEPRLKNGCKLIVYFPSRADLSNVDFFDIMGAGFLLLNRLLEDQETQVHGVLVLRCWEGVTFMEMMRMQIFFRKQANTFAALFQVSSTQSGWLASKEQHSLCCFYYELQTNSVSYNLV